MNMVGWGLYPMKIGGNNCNRSIRAIRVRKREFSNYQILDMREDIASVDKGATHLHDSLS